MSDGQQFETFEEFKEYAQTPVSVDDIGGIVEIYDPKTNEILNYDEADKIYWGEDYLKDAQGNLHPFMRRNMNIASYDYNEETFSDFVVWSKADSYIMGERIDQEQQVFFVICLIEVIAVVVFYLLKRNRIFKKYRGQG